jgi:hypothetical protein
VLTEVLFEPGSHLTQINGFQGCTSIRRIVIPPSVQSISRRAFSRCLSLRLIEFSGGSQLRDWSGLSGQRCFISHGDGDLKGMRSRFESDLVLRMLNRL